MVGSLYAMSAALSQTVSGKLEIQKKTWTQPPEFLPVSFSFPFLYSRANLHLTFWYFVNNTVPFSAFEELFYISVLLSLVLYLAYIHLQTGCGMQKAGCEASIDFLHLFCFVLFCLGTRWGARTNRTSRKPRRHSKLYALSYTTSLT